MSPQKPNDQYVSVPESGGTVKKIRNAEFVIVKADGSEHTVESQVTMNVRPDGTPADMDLQEVRLTLREIANRLSWITLLLEQVFASGNSQGTTQDTPDVQSQDLRGF